MDKPLQGYYPLEPEMLLLSALLLSVLLLSVLLFDSPKGIYYVALCSVLFALFSL